MTSHGRMWSRYDETSYRTGGMERVGYDADTQRYYFQEGTELYEGEPGVEFGGELRHIGSAPPRQETGPIAPEQSPWRQLAPFLLIVGVVLLLVFKYFPVFPQKSSPPFLCPSNLVKYSVAQGDNCWAIADSRGWNVDKLMEANPKLNCDILQVGAKICVPPFPKP